MLAEQPKVGAAQFLRFRAFDSRIALLGMDFSELCDYDGFRLAGRTHAAGLAAARRRGRVGGRKRRMTPGKVESARKLLKGGMVPRDVAQNLGVSIPTLYRSVPAASR